MQRRIIVATNAYPGGAGGLSRAIGLGIKIDAWITPSHNERDTPVPGGYNHRLAPVRTFKYDKHYAFCNEGPYWALLGAGEYLSSSNQLEGMTISQEVNDRVAHEIVQAVREKQQPAVIFVEDYQKWGVPQSLRELLPPDVIAVIQFMLHTSISHPSNPAWQRIPVDICKRYFRSPLGADQILCQTPRDVHHFKLHIMSWLGDEVEIDGDTIRYNNRLIHLRAIPIGTSPNHLNALLASREMQDARQQIQGILGSDDIVIANVSRTDPIKNYIPLIESMPLVLENLPEALRERVVLACHLTLNRQNLPLYRDYRERGDEAIRRINRQIGREVVKAYYSDDYPLALALMEKASVMAIPSIAEGMNLTGLECAYVSKRDAVLLLSENVGLSQISEGWAIQIADPTGEEIARGLIEALSLDPQQRAARARMARQTVQNYTIENWLANRLLFAEEHFHTC